MNKLNIFVFAAVCLSAEMLHAEDDIFMPSDPAEVAAKDFLPLEEVNSDLEQGMELLPITELAPVDYIADIEDPVGTEGAVVESTLPSKILEPDLTKAHKVELSGNIEKITLRNGDIVINVKGNVDFDETMNSILSGGMAGFGVDPPHRRSEE